MQQWTKPTIKKNNSWIINFNFLTITVNSGKHSQKFKECFIFLKTHFFWKKHKNGDGELLFTTKDALAQKLVGRLICLTFLGKECFFRGMMSLRNFLKTLNSFWKSVQPSSELVV